MQVNAISLPPLWCEGFIPQQTCIVWPLQTASCICLATQVSCTHIPKYKLLYWTTQSKPHHRLRGQHKVSLRHLRHTDSLALPCQHHVGNNLILSLPFSHRKVEDSLSNEHQTIAQKSGAQRNHCGTCYWLHPFATSHGSIIIIKWSRLTLLKRICKQASNR